MKKNGGQWMSNLEAADAMESAVSRMSKTIESIYLADREFKAANILHVYVVLSPR